MVIAIDGTSGSGKSTISRVLSERLAIPLLNTGEIYRRITWACLSLGIGEADVPRVVEQARLVSLSEPADLHSERISRHVPLYAKIPEVRAEVRQIQRNLATGSDWIVEGRDIGTVVFPNAEHKFFVTASLEERARRRQRQLGTTGEADFQAILENLRSRDHQDEHRETSPLVAASTAMVVDTTRLGVEEVVQLLVARIQGAAPRKNGG